jgi:hypothetical protein
MIFAFVLAAQFTAATIMSVNLRNIMTAYNNNMDLLAGF